MTGNVKPNSLAAWAVSCRPKTWGVASSPVLTGLFLALAQDGRIHWPIALATLLVAILMQAITNMENDAGYTRRRADNEIRRGLPRSTTKGWLTVAAVERGILLLALLAAALTAFLIWRGGWIFALLVGASLAAAYLYMGGPWPVAYTPFGELFVFLFFGLVAVCGSYYLQTLSLSVLAVTAAAAHGLLAAAVLVVNNYRDRAHDASVRRRTLAVILGERRMRLVFWACLLIPYLMIAALVVADHALAPLLTVLLTLPLALRLCWLLPRRRDLALNQVLFATVRLELAFALCLALGCVIIHWAR